MNVRIEKNEAELFSGTKKSIQNSYFLCGTYIYALQESV